MLCSSSSRIPCPLTISSRRYSSMKERSLTISSRVGRGPSGTERGQVLTEQQDTTSPHYQLHAHFFLMCSCPVTMYNVGLVKSSEVKRYQAHKHYAMVSTLPATMTLNIKKRKTKRWLPNPNTSHNIPPGNAALTCKVWLLKVESLRRHDPYTLLEDT